MKLNLMRYGGPTIAHILGRDDLPPPRDLDLSFLLDVLEKVGPDCAVYALPSLLYLLQKEGASDIGKQAYRLISSFEKEKLAPYTLLLPAASEMQSTNNGE